MKNKLYLSVTTKDELLQYIDSPLVEQVEDQDKEIRKLQQQLNDGFWKEVAEAVMDLRKQALAFIELIDNPMNNIAADVSFQWGGYLWDINSLMNQVARKQMELGQREIFKKAYVRDLFELVSPRQTYLLRKSIAGIPSSSLTRAAKTLLDYDLIREFNTGEGKAFAPTPKGYCFRYSRCYLDLME